MENFTTNKEAWDLAKKLLAQAEENEPTITADLQNIATAVSAEFVGLRNKFKTEESLTRKLVDKSFGDSQKLWQAAKTINDVLRYTFVLPFEIYAKGFHRTIKELRRTGYRIPEYKIWNAWHNVGSDKDRGYRGINITAISSKRQKFELQFHTEESFQLKTETHFLYEESRDKKTSRERIVEIIEILKNSATNIKKPNGV